MDVDVVGAVRTARLAAEFDWTWTRADLIRFCEGAGWQVSDHGAEGIAVTTNLDVRQPKARASIDAAELAHLGEFDQDVLEMTVVVARAATAVDGAATEVHFSEIARALSNDLGHGTSSHPGGESAPVWDLPKVFIRLGSVPGLIALYVINPAYQASIDAFQDEHDGDY